MDPRLAPALASFRQGRPDDARVAAQFLLMPGAPPDTAFAAASLLFDIAALYHSEGRLEDAEAVLRAILRFAPGDAATLNNLGLVLDDFGRPQEACEAFTRALASDPGMSAAHNNLGAVLAGQGRYTAAAAAHGAALRCDPLNAAARINLGVALLELGALDQAAAAFDAVLADTRTPESARRDAAGNRLYLEIYRETDPASVHARHRAWGAAVPPAVPSAAAPVDSAPGRALKVGYVSADFRRHSVSFFVEALLVHCDPAAVEVFCYADVARADAVTARLKAHVPGWRDIHGWSDARLCDAVRDDGIDILVDLSGHTRGNRLPAFARRPAPVQVTALGYPATTGLAAMDARLCDAITDPPGANAFSTERLVRLAALHCFAPPPDAPLPGPLPARGNGHVTFGSFNKLAKVGDATIRLWADILHAVPDARLVLKAKPLAEADSRAALAARFAAHGVAAYRLDLRGWAPDDAAHLRAYDAIDIALDTFPYNGTTTTCEALWMGVPVISLCGAGHAARVGASLLTSAGLADWICGTPGEMRARAQAACADLAGLAALRAGLRAQVHASRLCDGRAYARDVERAYREIAAG